MRMTRERMFSTGLLLIAWLGSTPRSLAGVGVFVVDDDGGPGVDFTDIPPAVAAALDGDRILVHDGTYSGFAVAAKSLTVRATGSNALVTGTVELRDSAPDGTLRLIGLHVVSTSRAVLVESCLGRVSLTSCILQGGEGACDPWPGGSFDGFPAIELRSASAVALFGCEARGGRGGYVFDAQNETGPTAGGPGLRLDDGSNAWAYDASFWGGGGGSVDDTEELWGARGGHGALVAEGFLFASGCTFRGGGGGFGGCGCGATCCGGGGSGGDGLRLQGPGPLAHHLACTFLGGPGGATGGDGAPNGSPGLPIRILSGAAQEVPAAAPPICFGDGSGTACPCDNFGAPGAGCANSSGSGAVLGASGTTSTVFEDLQLLGANATPGQVGLFVQGATAIAPPFADGIRCVGSPTVRLEIVSLDATGSAASSVSIPDGGGAGPGDRRYYQLWYRDPTGPCHTGSNLSNAVQVDWH